MINLVSKPRVVLYYYNLKCSHSWHTLVLQLLGSAISTTTMPPLLLKLLCMFGFKSDLGWAKKCFFVEYDSYIRYHFCILIWSGGEYSKLWGQSYITEARIVRMDRVWSSKPPVVMAGRRPAMTTGGLDNTHIGTPYNPSGSAQRFCYQLWKMKENINFSFRAKKVRFP